MNPLRRSDIACRNRRQRHRAATAFVALAVCALAALWPVVIAAQVAPAFNGTWTLNQDKSMFEPLATRPDRRTVTLSVTGSELTHNTETGRTRFLDVEPFQEVSTTKVSYTAKFDGKQYSVPNSTAKVTLKRLSATSFERTAVAGKASETATWTVSADGKTLTVTTKGVDAEGTPYSSTQVFDKQS